MFFVTFLYSHLVLSCDTGNFNININQQNQLAHINIFQFVTPFFMNAQKIKVSKQKQKINMETFSDKIMEVEFSILFLENSKSGFDSIPKKISDANLSPILTNTYIIMADSKRTKLLTQVFYEYNFTQKNLLKFKEINKLDDIYILNKQIDIIQDLLNKKLGFGEWLYLGELTGFPIADKTINLLVLSNTNRTDLMLLGSF